MAAAPDEDAAAAGGSGGGGVACIPPLRARARSAQGCCMTLTLCVSAMLQKLEEMQLKDTLRMFNGLVERCFCECLISLFVTARMMARLPRVD